MGWTRQDNGTAAPTTSTETLRVAHDEVVVRLDHGRALALRAALMHAIHPSSNLSDEDRAAMENARLSINLAIAQAERRIMDRAHEELEAL